MTALNKAFIKAYTKDEPHAHVPRPHFAVQPIAAVQRQAARETADRIVAEERRRSASIKTHAAAVRPFVPPPKLGPTLFGDSTSPQQDGEFPSITKIPLAHAAHVRPAFEVDQFAWPQVCKTLSKKIGDQLDAVATALARTSGGGSRIVGFAGVERGVGCTTIAITLAHQLCQRRSATSDAKVLLIDADLKHSELATCLGLAPQACWNDTDLGNVPLEDALVESLSDRMVVMPISGGVRKSNRPIDAQKISADLETLAGQHQTVLIDLGSLEGADDCGALEAIGGCLDTLLLVRDARMSDDSQIEAAIELATQVGIDVAGIIENWSAESARTTKAA